jgi:hypothetical protein
MLFLNMVCLTVALAFAPAQESDRKKHKRGGKQKTFFPSETFWSFLVLSLVKDIGMSKGIADGRRSPAALKRPQSSFRSGPPTGRRRVGHGGLG